MHFFDDLILRGTTYTLNALNAANDRALDNLQTGARTADVKTLQAVRFQKVILATGMFSIFEALLQDGLSCTDGFKEVKKILLQKNEVDLHNRFENFELAVNVLKHGRGRSYNTLVTRATTLPFRVKLPNEDFFFEGDVSEISTLVEVDDTFVTNCADLIETVLDVVRKDQPFGTL